MSDTPPRRPLYEVADVIFGNPFRSELFNSGGVGTPLLRIRDLETGTPAIHTTEDADDRYVVRSGDLVVGMDGEFRIHTWRGADVWLNQRVCKVVPKAGNWAAPYLKAVLAPELMRIERVKTGTTVIHLNKSDLERISVAWMPIEEQRAIASVLGALDDKIELNRRMNETLEALARAIFTSWFVDFDPVRAKAEGRQPVGMDAETAALFPDSFEDSPLGPIPCGWQVVRLGAQIEVVRGLSYSGAGLTDADGGGLPLHNLNSIFEGGGYKHEGIKWYAGEYQDRHLVAPGDLIVANTERGCGQLLIGFPAIVPTRYGDIGLFSHHLYRVRPRSDSSLTAQYLYLLLATARYHAEVAGHANGTTINMLPADALTRPWIALPPRALVARFDALVSSMLARQELLHRESDSLARTRDALLPKLVSGQIRPPFVDGSDLRVPATDSPRPDDGFNLSP
jgi:type I restriction enzyme S subunit